MINVKKSQICKNLCIFLKKNYDNKHLYYLIFLNSMDKIKIITQTRTNQIFAF